MRGDTVVELFDFVISCVSSVSLSECAPSCIVCFGWLQKVRHFICARKYLFFFFLSFVEFIVLNAYGVAYPLSLSHHHQYHDHHGNRCRHDFTHFNSEGLFRQCTKGKKTHPAKRSCPGNRTRRPWNAVCSPCGTLSTSRAKPNSNTKFTMVSSITPSTHPTCPLLITKADFLPRPENSGRAQIIVVFITNPNGKKGKRYREGPILNPWIFVKIHWRTKLIN